MPITCRSRRRLRGSLMGHCPPRPRDARPARRHAVGIPGVEPHDPGRPLGYPGSRGALDDHATRRLRVHVRQSGRCDTAIARPFAVIPACHGSFTRRRFRAAAVVRRRRATGTVDRQCRTTRASRLKWIHDSVAGCCSSCRRRRVRRTRYGQVVAPSSPIRGASAELFLRPCAFISHQSGDKVAARAIAPYVLDSGIDVDTLHGWLTKVDSTLVHAPQAGRGVDIPDIWRFVRQKAS
jgi:hypothetical protein